MADAPKGDTLGEKYGVGGAWANVQDPHIIRPGVTPVAAAPQAPAAKTTTSPPAKQAAAAPSAMDRLADGVIAGYAAVAGVEPSLVSPTFPTVVVRPEVKKPDSVAGKRRSLSVQHSKVPHAGYHAPSSESTQAVAAGVTMTTHKDKSVTFTTFDLKTGRQEHTGRVSADQAKTVLAAIDKNPGNGFNIAHQHLTMEEQVGNTGQKLAAQSTTHKSSGQAVVHAQKKKAATFGAPHT